jgi:hypothetical protein
MSPSQLFNWYWGSREYGIYEDFNTVSATNMIHISSKSRPYLSFSIYYFLVFSFFIHGSYHSPTLGSPLAPHPYISHLPLFSCTTMHGRARRHRAQWSSSPTTCSKLTYFLLEEVSAYQNLETVLTVLYKPPWYGNKESAAVIFCIFP